MLRPVFERHALAFPSEYGREIAWHERKSPYPDERWLARAWEEYRAIPAIVRSEESGIVSVGFSFPIRDGGVRWRMAARIPAGEIKRTVSPWRSALMCTRGSCEVSALVREALTESIRQGAVLGIFGSAALQTVTGLPYLHDDSDVDMVLAASSPDAIRRIAEVLCTLEEKYRRRIDAEVVTNGRYYVKLKELLGGGTTVLAKSAGQPELLSSRAVWENLPGTAEIEEIINSGNEV